MLRFTLKRIAVAVPLLLFMTLVTFFIMQKTTGNFYDLLKLDPRISPETIVRYQELYQLDQPLIVQYLQWLKNLLRLEFGYSFYYNIPVGHVISGRVFNTFILALTCFLVTWSIAIPLGIWAAFHRNRLIDRIIQLFSYVALSTPSFFLVMLLLFWGSKTGFLPLGGMRSATYDDLSTFGKIIDVLKHMAIPVMAITIGGVGSLQRLMRGNMLEVLRQQYILTARAKGLPENKVIYGHALRNAVNPLITLLGYELGDLLSGAALIEIIYGWPGLGNLMLTAVQSKDIYLVMAGLVMGGALFLMGNLIADLILARVDPRIRYE
jgi:peptide/nickel transport system permease protein